MGEQLNKQLRHKLQCAIIPVPISPLYPKHNPQNNATISHKSQMSTVIFKLFHHTVKLRYARSLFYSTRNIEANKYAQIPLGSSRNLSETFKQAGV